jgi:hypothetical protein
MERVGGIIRFTIDGAQYRAKGNFSYMIGNPKREAIIGSDGVHGYKETPQAPFIEGTITDSASLSLSDLTSITDSTVILTLANGKSVVLRDAFYASEGEASTEAGEIKVRFEGISAEEMS